MNKEQYKQWCIQNTLKEIYGEEYVSWCVQEFDKARNYLKNCGKPKDWYDGWLIGFHKETTSMFKRFK